MTPSAQGTDGSVEWLEGVSGGVFDCVDTRAESSCAGPSAAVAAAGRSASVPAERAVASAADSTFRQVPPGPLAARREVFLIWIFFRPSLAVQWSVCTGRRTHLAV
ncbi:hypothetical protein CUT44_32510 [Streptomyces carminius]|uniref:Uncharacterized protein n=1 Tax=Streptomyces carminius TaxID=2665496 RepID=A0A2M8LPP3_9ACTN|nr:hypothetical protein CUT44_32510 [Streptomyces carminius]